MLSISVLWTAIVISHLFITLPAYAKFRGWIQKKKDFFLVNTRKGISVLQQQLYLLRRK